MYGADRPGGSLTSRLMARPVTDHGMTHSQ
jgi:hypothetical protein